ncbi:MAG TPA: sulfite exporter TauE/SafE family protein [Propionicimonas sp.]|uniref:sulfite exporter TauE/SafE family protein n=1 Tax=Propionicimonas sp. TaxID=1955623 RepID=UPI002F421E6C
MDGLATLWISLPLWGWLVLALCALLIGFSKTALGGLALVAVVLTSQVVATKDSTAVVLVMLLVGDLVATWTYRHDVDWRLIGRLIPPVLVGIGAGALFLNWVDGPTLKRTMGAIMLVLLVLGLWPDKLAAHRPSVGMAYGGLAGFTTMVANGGGPPMSLYLLARKYDKLRFLGTTAWFFFAVNLIKVPFSIGNGILRAETAVLGAVLAPLVLVGTWIGRLTIKRINQATFERLVTAFVAVAAIYLLFG